MPTPCVCDGADNKGENRGSLHAGQALPATTPATHTLLLLLLLLRALERATGARAFHTARARPQTHSHTPVVVCGLLEPPESPNDHVQAPVAAVPAASHRRRGSRSALVSAGELPPHVRGRHLALSPHTHTHTGAPQSVPASLRLLIPDTACGWRGGLVLVRIPATPTSTKRVRQGGRGPLGGGGRRAEAHQPSRTAPRQAAAGVQVDWMPVRLQNLLFRHARACAHLSTLNSCLGSSRMARFAVDVRHASTTCTHQRTHAHLQPHRHARAHTGLHRGHLSPCSQVYDDRCSRGYTNQGQLSMAFDATGILHTSALSMYVCNDATSG